MVGWKYVTTCDTMPRMTPPIMAPVMLPRPPSTTTIMAMTVY